MTPYTLPFSTASFQETLPEKTEEVKRCTEDNCVSPMPVNIAISFSTVTD